MVTCKSSPVQGTSDHKRMVFISSETDPDTRSQECVVVVVGHETLISQLLESVCVRAYAKDLLYKTEYFIVQSPTD